LLISMETFGLKPRSSSSSSSSSSLRREADIRDWRREADIRDWRREAVVVDIRDPVILELRWFRRLGLWPWRWLWRRSLLLPHPYIE
jgi:hypothetical protein